MDFYKLSVKETLKELNSNRSGLENSSVIKRRLKYGKNEINIRNHNSFLKFFLLQFNNYLMWLLIVISGFAFISGYHLKLNEQIIDGFIILLIILINAIVGAYQDFKSEKSAELLESMLKTKTLVLRNNKTEQIDSKDLVVGDIIILESGNKVPADCRVLSSENFKVNEASLTGESEDIFKDNKTIKKSVSLAERKNSIYMNNFVTNGSAICVVTAIGKKTEVGKIAEMLEIEEPKSAFLKEVDLASKKITVIAMILIVLVMFVLYFHHQKWISVFMIGSALVIGSIPEGLPAIVTFALAMSSVKLAKQNVLIKKKSVLETLGSVDILCTDKTGTLTQNKMTIKTILVDGYEGNDYKNLNPITKNHFIHCALLANEAKETDDGYVGEAEDLALINYFSDESNPELLRVKFPEKDFSPFSSDTKLCSSKNKVNKKIITYKKGASEVILSNCGLFLNRGKVVKLTNIQKEKIRNTITNFSKNSLRVIAYSYIEDKKEIFIGISGMHDPPKEGVRQAVSKVYSAGIDIKMITGDSIDTAKAIAKECGFKNVKAVEWNEIKELSDDKLIKVVNTHNVFSRMSPDFKTKIVNLLQLSGKRVAVTGDGVNDVPALKIAEVGIAIGNNSSDIAKEASDLIILGSHINVIIAAIKEGRTIFSNIRKVLNYLLTANVAEVVVVFLSSLFGVVPFVAVQLLWVNFVTDLGPAMALGIDPSHSDIMKKKPTGKNETLINKRITLLTVFIGLKKVAIIFALFWLSLKFTNNLLIAQTMTFSWLVFSHLVRVATIRFDEKEKMFNNKVLNWTLAVPVLLQILIIHSPLSKLFHVTSLNFILWSSLILAIVIAIFFAKLITYFVSKLAPNTKQDY